MVELSVVIPARDAAHVLPNQLEALASEHPDFDWEVVVVDNASEDDTAHVAERLSAALPIRVVSERLPGRHHACNRGATEALGDRISFVDADDIVLPGYLQAMFGALRQSDFVAGRLVHDEDMELGAFGNMQAAGVAPLLGFLPFATGANLGVTKQAFLDVGGFNADVPFGEDIDLSWRLQIAGHDIAFCPDAMVRYHQRSSLRQMFTQHRRFGMAHALLYAKYAELGMPRRPPTDIRRDWFASVAALPHLRDPGVRARWVRRTARSIGRIQGSFRTRRMYL